MSKSNVDYKKIVDVYQALEGNATQTAKKLGIGRATVYRALKSENIEPYPNTRPNSVSDNLKTKGISIQKRMKKDQVIDVKVAEIQVDDEGLELFSLGEPLRNVSHELFCRYYCSPSLRGNAVQSYIRAIKAPEPKNQKEYNRLSAQAHVVLNRSDVGARIREIHGCVVNHSMVDGELAFLVMQYTDLKTKLGAIKEYNELTGRKLSKEQTTLPTARENVLSKLFGQNNDVQEAEVLEDEEQDD